VIRSHASANVSSQYGCCSRVSLGDAFSTCTCTRAEVAPFCVARRISVNVNKFILLKCITTRKLCRSVRCAQRGPVTGQRIPPRTAHATAFRFRAPMFLKRLECSACGREHEWSRLQNLCCSCNKPLFAIVDLAGATQTMTRETMLARGKSLWRYRE